MAVPMVHVRNVLVFMGRAGMHVRMRTWFSDYAVVLVLMVLVVNVQMLMKDGLVRVEMSACRRARPHRNCGRGADLGTRAISCQSSTTEQGSCV